VLSFPDRKFKLQEATRGQYRAPTAGDARSPCPGWNTLANHGFINRNGRGITYDSFIQACSDAFGLSKVVSNIGAINAQIAAEIFPNGVMPSLEVLNPTHNKIEHDASLTRLDLYLGDNIHLNQGLLNQMVPNRTSFLRKEDIAAARTKRIQDSTAKNPTFTWKVTQQQPVSAAESAFLHTIFGNGTGTGAFIPARFLYDFLLNERLPSGWTKRSSTIGSVEFLAVSAYYLAREVISFGDSGMTEAQAHEFATMRMKRFIEEGK